MGKISYIKVKHLHPLLFYSRDIKLSGFAVLNLNSQMYMLFNYSPPPQKINKFGKYAFLRHFNRSFV